VPSALQPLRVLLDSRVRTPATARLLAPPGHCLLCHCAEPSPAQHAELMARGVELLQLPADLNGRVDPAALLDELARRGINELHVEAGATLNGAWLAGSWVDEWLVYLAPKLVGGGRAMAAFGPLATLADAAELEFTSVQQIGPDLRVLARPHGRLGTWLKSGT
jgi:diaminohydroxyphosphoribosylaminopyrimidine deaminase/5-amino-6-(5-phosphoribosylamino)uracil reductase